MPMLGTNPWTPPGGGPTIRQSLSVERGMQAFWTSRGGGYGLKVDHISNPHPELIALGMDTIVLNPVDYEAVKKSAQEAPRRDRARAGSRRTITKDLQGFDAAANFWKRFGEDQEHKRSRG